MPSIDNWNSIGIDWEYPQLCTYYSALESIRLALVERDLATSGFSPAILIGQVLLLYSLREYAEAIQNTITSLIPCFANHTDNGGNWDGKTDIPAWTESSILEAIGAEKRLLVNKLNVLSAAWVTQQYQILNMLKWRLVKLKLKLKLKKKLNLIYKKKLKLNLLVLIQLVKKNILILWH